MLPIFILISYRAIAFFILISPIILNFIYPSDNISISLIYVPSIMLALGFLAAYIDTRIVRVIKG